MATFVKVGAECHDHQGKGANIIGYQGPDGDNAMAAYVALKSFADGMQQVGVFADARVYLTAFPPPK